MFDDVSGRYDLLNRIMSLGRDASWRRAMWNEVPEESSAVLDLCCGSGVSLAGLRRPGRLVIGADVSLGMLEIAAEDHGHAGWAPRLVAADAFRLPIRSSMLDAVTVAFGVRNLRPRESALREIARVLAPGGRLIVLEATAPGTNPIAPLHRFYVRTLIPLAGRLSPDPSAYAYLSRSILEFGSGPEFEADLASSGFTLASRRSFMFGATRLWVAQRTARVGEDLPASARTLHSARLGELARGEMRMRPGSGAAEWRWWTGAQLVVALILAATLAYALWSFLNSNIGASLEGWQRSGMKVLLAVGTVGFVVRAIALTLRLTGPPPPR